MRFDQARILTNAATNLCGGVPIPMSKNKQDQRRAYFRLRYPTSEGPAVTIAGADYEVLEISEAGARIKLLPDASIAIGQAFSGIVRFDDGVIVPVKGEVSRIDGDQAALKLSPGVSLRRMLAEQRHILERHPEILQEQEQQDRNMPS